jgi:hypothetical protein
MEYWNDGIMKGKEGTLLCNMVLAFSGFLQHSIVPIP